MSECPHESVIHRIFSNESVIHRTFLLNMVKETGRKPNTKIVI